MARWKLTARKSIPQVVTPKEWARRFRSFNREVGLIFGEFLPRYFAIWQKAKNYITDYEACEELVNQLPTNWRMWADEQRKQLIFRDSITHALRCHFPKLLCRLFEQWIVNGEPPNSAHASSNVVPIESSNHASSDERSKSVLRTHKPSSPSEGANDLEAGTSTKFVLRRESATKRPLDDHDDDLSVDAAIKRYCSMLPDEEHGDLDSNI